MVPLRLAPLVVVLALLATACVVPARTVRRDATESVESGYHDPDREGTLIGAAAGAAAGALIGYLSARSSGPSRGLIARMVASVAIDASDAFEPGAGHQPTVT